MDASDALWLAGLLEGEGTFFTYGAGQTVGTRPCARVALQMADRDVVERAARLMGATSVALRPRKNGHKSMHQAVVNGAQAEVVMRAILPYMGQRRTDKINDILDLELSHH